jgi:xanthine dehydrogenase YagS FAD-binding subunit
MRAFEYAQATDLNEAVALLNCDGGGRLLAGGTDLLPLMKADIAAPERLIDIKHLRGLGPGVVESGDGLTIGALTPLAVLAADRVVHDRYTVLADAAGLAATPQLRNMATLGGNLLQRPRCWYYRNAAFNCWLKGGEECFARAGENQLHAVFGESPCVAVHPSDPPAALLALGAEVRLTGRSLPMSEFFRLPSDEQRIENVLGPDELVLSVHIPNPAPDTVSCYVKAMNRKVWSFALVGVAAVVRFEPQSRQVADARLVLNGVAPIPWRSTAAEWELVGHTLTEQTIDRAAEAALTNAEPLAHNAYKLPLAAGLIHQALAAL